MAATPSPSSSLYDVLGITTMATSGDIKAAYRRLALACHPDVVSADKRGASADGFMRIHAAYATLSDPDKRADYNRRMVVAPARQRWPARPSPPSSSSGHGRRSWETDQCW